MTKSAVPAGSVAASRFAGGVEPGEPQGIPLEMWAEDSEGAIAGDILEDAFRLDEYDQAMILLSLP